MAKRGRRKKQDGRGKTRRGGASGEASSEGEFRFATDAEIEKLAAAIEVQLGELIRLGRAHGIDVRESLRWRPLADGCRVEREALGASIKELAAELRCPQYRIRAIEQTSFRELQPAVVRRVFDRLGLGRFLEAWEAANPALAAKLGLGPATAPKPARRSARRQPTHIYRLKIQLLHVDPPVWRRIEVPANGTFWDLHVAIQDSMGWLDCHLHAFARAEGGRMPAETIGIPDPDGFDPAPCRPGWETPMARWLQKRGDVVRYEYDFGDGWEHRLELEAIEPAAPGVAYPRCVAGERACPPEDCGGPPGYSELREILSDPRHEEHRSMRKWLGRPLDPERFDAGAVRFDDPAERFRIAFGDARA